MTELLVLIGLGVVAIFIIVPVIVLSIVGGFQGPHIPSPPPVGRPIGIKMYSDTTENKN